MATVFMHKKMSANILCPKIAVFTINIAAINNANKIMYYMQLEYYNKTNDSSSSK